MQNIVLFVIFSVLLATARVVFLTWTIQHTFSQRRRNEFPENRYKIVSDMMYKMSWLA